MHCETSSAIVLCGLEKERREEEGGGGMEERRKGDEGRVGKERMEGSIGLYSTVQHSTVDSTVQEYFSTHSAVQQSTCSAVQYIYSTCSAVTSASSEMPLALCCAYSR
jgi:hypothetical protein